MTHEWTPTLPTSATLQPLRRPLVCAEKEVVVSHPGRPPPLERPREARTQVPRHRSRRGLFLLWSAPPPKTPDLAASVLCQEHPEHSSQQGGATSRYSQSQRTKSATHSHPNHRPPLAWVRWQRAAGTVVGPRDPPAAPAQWQAFYATRCGVWCAVGTRHGRQGPTVAPAWRPPCVASGQPRWCGSVRAWTPPAWSTRAVRPQLGAGSRPSTRRFRGTRQSVCLACRKRRHLATSCGT